MSLFVYIEQILRVDVSVALGGRQAGVPQELLNRAKITATLQQVGGEGMPQGVRAGLGSNRRADETSSDDAANSAVGQGLPS